MPIIENTYERELDELHKAVKALDRALDIRGQQDGAIFLQSYHLIQDAARLYEENDKLREVARDAWKLFIKHGATHPWDLQHVDDVRTRLEVLGVEVERL